MIIPQGIQAIDMHVHLADARSKSFHAQQSSQMASYFGARNEDISIEETADYYRSRSMMAVIMNSADRTRTGADSMPNEYVAEVVESHPDVFLGFGAINPWEGRLAQREIERCAELGLIGIGELNAARQQFYPNDPRFGDLWAAASELNLIVLFHGGYAAAGSGTPGGSGVKLKYSRPIHLDDVAAEHPELSIICAHPSWPWEDEALATALHKGNVFLDLSGWAPKYFSPGLIRYVTTRLQDKVLFGSDFPLLLPDRWLEEFKSLGIGDEVMQKVLIENARKLLQR